jgi:hypothetical protein
MLKGTGNRKKSQDDHTPQDELKTSYSLANIHSIVRRKVSGAEKEPARPPIPQHILQRRNSDDSLPSPIPPPPPPVLSPNSHKRAKSGVLPTSPSIPPPPTSPPDASSPIKQIASPVGPEAKFFVIQENFRKSMVADTRSIENSPSKQKYATAMRKKLGDLVIPAGGKTINEDGDSSDEDLDYQYIPADAKSARNSNLSDDHDQVSPLRVHSAK